MRFISYACAFAIAWSVGTATLTAQSIITHSTSVPSQPAPGGIILLGAQPSAPQIAASTPALEEPFLSFETEDTGSGPRLWARAEYLHLWYKDASSPPLVTTLPVTALPTIDRSTTIVLFGGTLEGQDHPGGRFTLGFACPNSKFGVELTYLLSSWRDNDFFASSPGVPVLGRPFFDISTGAIIPVVESVANPVGLGIAPLSGSITISNPSRMYGFEANGVCCWCADPCRNHRLELLVGFRHLALNEDLHITEDLAFQDGTGETTVVRDSFSARNDFYGGQIGIRGEHGMGNFFVRGTAKVALGVTHHVVTIDGFTADNITGTNAGGLLALVTNIGKYDDDSFCVIPEIELTAGVYLTERLRLYAGYTFLYASKVVRPGEQIDPVVNQNFIPIVIGGGPIRPTFVQHTTDFWAQGIVCGMEVSW